MKTAKITATFAIAGKIAIQFDIDITDHYAREILDAIGSTINDKWSDGNVTRVEKDKLSLTRKAKDDSLDQIAVPGTEVVNAVFEVVPQLEGKEPLALPEPEITETEDDFPDFPEEPETEGGAK